MQMGFIWQMCEQVAWLMTGPDEESGTDNRPAQSGQPGESGGGSGGIQHDVLRRDDLDDEGARISRDNELDDALLD